LMSDTDHSIEILRQLKQMGIRVSIDDFGTGYSSLAYLRRFPMDALKIDQSFIHDLHTDPEAKFIVLAIIDLAHRLNLKVVAEGVETVEQARFLRANGCDQAQGYWIAMPMPPGKIEELWRQNPRVDMDGISTISI
jgi:EAL domain-containing protein (putative c-di-GMP-specific phosphodiesterase class I)